MLRVGLTPLERPRRIRGTVAYLSNTRPDNYGHWLFFTLPMIRYYRELLGTDPDFYYVGKPLLEEHVDSLAMLDIPESRILERGVVADRLLTVVADRSGGIDRDFLLFAAENLPATPDTADSSERRIFISRAGAGHRRLVNEAECAKRLARSFGIEVVSTERMSLRDEIALFRRARLVVAPHGAGLANIAFAPNGSTVIDLASTTYWTPFFAELAAAKEHRYGLLRGEPEPNGLRAPPSEQDFAVDIDELERAVAAALEHAAPSRM
jgi:capsular polysaccharide biosynthesis protein